MNLHKEEGHVRVQIQDVNRVAKSFEAYDFILSSDSICSGPCILEYRKYKKGFSLSLGFLEILTMFCHPNQSAECIECILWGLKY